MPRIDQVQRRRLVADAPVGRLATVTADGRPHVVPCCFVLRGSDLQPSDLQPSESQPSDPPFGETVYSVVDGKPKSTMALKRLDNVRATGGASLVVDHYDDDWAQLWWVRVDGEASVLEAGEEWQLAIDALGAKYRQYREHPPTGSVLRIAVTGWSDWTASPITDPPMSEGR